MPTAQTYQAKCWNLPFWTKFMSHLRAMIPKTNATTMPTKSSGVNPPASTHFKAFSGSRSAFSGVMLWHLIHLMQSRRAAPPTAGMLMRKLNSPAYLRFTPMNIMALMVEPLRLMPGMQAMPWTVPVTSARHQFILTPSLSGRTVPISKGERCCYGHPRSCHSSTRHDSISSAIRMSSLILAALASLVILEARSADRNHYFLFCSCGGNP